jgi:hypothetical protein
MVMKRKSIYNYAYVAAATLLIAWIVFIINASGSVVGWISMLFLFSCHCFSLKSQE